MGEELCDDEAIAMARLGRLRKLAFCDEMAGTVATLVDGDVPQPLKEPKAAKELLDALAANHVYFHIFTVPFFSTPNHRMQGLGDLD